MDAFDDAFGAAPAAAPAGEVDAFAAAEVDPAAEFLPQEQADLGGLGEDIGITSPQETEENIAVVEQSSGDSNFDFLADAEPTNVDFEDNPIQSAGVDQMSNGFSNMSVKIDPESIRQWKIEQEARLVEKDRNEEKNLQELKAQAQKELDDWYKHYNAEMEKTRETNRAAQETLVSEVSQMNDIEPGTEWDRVAKQCDFNSKTARNTKDVSRMRGILLQLKQNPPARD